jgi:hypothetical protein
MKLEPVGVRYELDAPRVGTSSAPSESPVRDAADIDYASRHLALFLEKRRVTESAEKRLDCAQCGSPLTQPVSGRPRTYAVRCVGGAAHRSLDHLERWC